MLSCLLFRYRDVQFRNCYIFELSFSCVFQSTWECALLAAGSAIQLVDEICQGKVQNGMALTR